MIETIYEANLFIPQQTSQSDISKLYWSLWVELHLSGYVNTSIWFDREVNWTLCHALCSNEPNKQIRNFKLVMGCYVIFFFYLLSKIYKKKTHYDYILSSNLKPFSIAFCFLFNGRRKFVDYLFFLKVVLFS